MRDAKRIQEHPGPQLARAQIVWLTLGGVVAIGITFALGVMVGRRAEKLAVAQHEEPADPLKRIDDERKLHDELTFYARLTQAKAERPGLAEPLPSRKTRAPDTTKMATDAIDEGATAVTPRAPIADANTLVQTAVAAAPTTPALVAPVIADQASAEANRALARGPAKTGEYTIQVSSFQTLEEANAYAASLKRKGYTPHIVSTQIAGKGTWHRVRLGAFASADAATQGKAQLGQADIAGWVVKSE